MADREADASCAMMTDKEHLGSATALIAMIQRGAMAQTVCVAAELRVADMLADGPRHCVRCSVLIFGWCAFRQTRL